MNGEKIVMAQNNKESKELPQYSEGLLKIMEVRGVNLEKALQIALEDLEREKDLNM